ncbi:DUF3768 domain-containing protein [Aquimarina macrocephali]|uniref:DUF3768 domain-containing protein n=1 Tax=Aquimarina macrocephali TaxID=666563 RepID=UPI0004B0C4DC|nr:DUF3768 domain-containing protein [Aquimarina macrocephali]
MTRYEQPFQEYFQNVKDMLLEQYESSIDSVDQRQIIKSHDVKESVQLCVQKLAVQYSLSATKDEYRIKTELIQFQNDLFRTSPIIADGYGVKGTVVITQGIAALSKEDQAAIIHKIINFDEFSEDNDPHGEHDFGAIEHGGEKIFWKIDYYNMSLDMGSPDAADPKETKRVLTIMFASEY